MIFDTLSQPIVETPRLLLRPMCPQDAEQVVRWRNADHVRSMSRSDALFTVEGHLAWFHSTRNDRVDYVLVEKESGRAFGSFSLTAREDASVGSCVEIGNYIGDTDMLGKGYGAEAMSAWLDLAFGHWQVPAVIAWTKRGNVRNIALNRKFGFVLVERPDASASGTPPSDEDLVLMHLPRGLWTSPSGRA